MKPIPLYWWRGEPNFGDALSPWIIESLLGAPVRWSADAGKLVGLFTDSDLARLFETNNNTALDEPIERVMTRNPLTVMPSVRLIEAVELMRSKKISELPVVDGDGRPVGMLDITDLIGLLPPVEGTASRPNLKLYGPTRA